MRIRTFVCASLTPAVEITPEIAHQAWAGLWPQTGMTPMSSEMLSVLDVSVIEAMRSLGEADVFVEVARMFLEDVPLAAPSADRQVLIH